MAKKSPTQKALAELRGEGWVVDKVEQRLPIIGRFITRDLFGIIDLIAMKPGEPLLAIQVTSRTNVSSRMAKALAGGKAKIWTSTGNRFEVWGFGPNGKRVVVMGLDGQFYDKEDA